MNLYKDSTKINQFLQEHLKIRDSNILPCLPQNPEELAATKGAFQRSHLCYSPNHNRMKPEFLRMIVQKLPEEGTEKIRKRKRRKASKTQNRIADDALFCAGYIVLITSLEAGYSAGEILCLYKIHWQA